MLFEPVREFVTALDTHLCVVFSLTTIVSTNCLRINWYKSDSNIVARKGLVRPKILGITAPKS